MPPPRSFEDELASEPWFQVGPDDIFPEELKRFLGLTGDLRDAFLEAVSRGRQHAEAGDIVTFGVTPDAPETGYGYIQHGDALPDGHSYRVARFVEKPDTATANMYLASGEFDWNSGIFLLRAGRWLEEITARQPAILEACEAAMQQGEQDSDFFRVQREAFLASPANSIDYAVMEHTSRAVVVPFSAGWSDVGSWSSLWQVCPRDAEGKEETVEWTSPC